MWHVIQTTTGKEEILIQAIEKLVPKSLYSKCFVIHRERVWKIGGTYKVHIDTLFPSYVFVVTTIPEKFFFALKGVPRFSKLLGEDAIFWTVRQDEQDFLENLLDGDSEYIVRRSIVEVGHDRQIIRAEGPLGHYIGKIVKQRLRKRCVHIEVTLGGEIRKIALGIDMKDDL